MLSESIRRKTFLLELLQIPHTHGEYRHLPNITPLVLLHAFEFVGSRRMINGEADQKMDTANDESTIPNAFMYKLSDIKRVGRRLHNGVMLRYIRAVEDSFIRSHPLSTCLLLGCWRWEELLCTVQNCTSVRVYEFNEYRCTSMYVEAVHSLISSTALI